MGAQCGQHQHPDYLQLCTKGRQKSLDLPLFEMAYEGPELVEALTHRLFQLHDLNKNGLLEEEELVQLNKKIAMLHHGKENTDKEEVKARYQTLFRLELDFEGKPVRYDTFRDYIIKVLSRMGADNHVEQSMILEQFIIEAVQARMAFHDPSLESAADAPYLQTISIDEVAALERWASSPELSVPRQSLCHQDDDQLTVASTTAASTAASPFDSATGRTSSDSNNNLFGTRTSLSSEGTPDSQRTTASSQVSSSSSSPGCGMCKAERHPHKDTCLPMPDLAAVLTELRRRCEEQLGRDLLLCLDDDEEGEAQVEATDSGRTRGERRRCLSNMSLCSDVSGSLTRSAPGSPPALVDP